MYIYHYHLSTYSRSRDGNPQTDEDKEYFTSPLETLPSPPKHDLERWGPHLVRLLLAYYVFVSCYLLLFYLYYGDYWLINVYFLLY